MSQLTMDDHMAGVTRVRDARIYTEYPEVIEVRAAVACALCGTSGHGVLRVRRELIDSAVSPAMLLRPQRDVLAKVGEELKKHYRDKHGYRG